MISWCINPSSPNHHRSNSEPMFFCTNFAFTTWCSGTRSLEIHGHKRAWITVPTPSTSTSSSWSPKGLGSGSPKSTGSVCYLGAAWWMFLYRSYPWWFLWDRQGYSTNTWGCKLGTFLPSGVPTRPAEQVASKSELFFPASWSISYWIPAILCDSSSRSNKVTDQNKACLR